MPLKFSLNENNKINFNEVKPEDIIFSIKAFLQWIGEILKL